MAEEKQKHEEIQISLIDEGVRQRTGYGDVEGLMFSIEQFGLLQPIVVEEQPSGRYTVIAGACRLNAFKQLGRTTIPAILRKNLDEVTRLEIELEENTRRTDFSWFEIAKAKTDLHKLKVEKYKNNLPSKFGRGWGQKDTAKELKVSEATLSQDIALVEAAEKDPSILKLQTRRDALKALNRINLGAPKEDSVILKKLKESFVHADIISGIKSVEVGSVNLIITDITESGTSFIPDLLHKLTANGHAFIFFSLDQYQDLLALLKESKSPHSIDPYIWHVVGEDTYRMFLWCSRYIVDAPPSIKKHHSHRQDPDSIHRLHKPYRLLQTLVEGATGKGNFIFDPCAYGTSMIKVCTDTARNCRVVCQNGTLYEQSILNYNKQVTEKI